MITDDNVQDAFRRLDDFFSVNPSRTAEGFEDAVHAWFTSMGFTHEVQLEVDRLFPDSPFRRYTRPDFNMGIMLGLMIASEAGADLVPSLWGDDDTA